LICYPGVDAEEAISDFLERIKHYEVRYMFLLPIKTTNYTVE